MDIDWITTRALEIGISLTAMGVGLWAVMSGALAALEFWRAFVG